MDLGKELIRVDCPEKYYKINVSSYILSAILVLCTDLLVTFFVGGIESVIYAFISFPFWYGAVIVGEYHNLKQFENTFISVCEKGICGNYALLGKHKSFELLYTDIRKAKDAKYSFQKKCVNVYLKEKRGCIQVLVDNPQRIADKINEKIVSKTFFNK